MVMEDFVTYDYATQTYSNVSRTTPHSLAGEAQFIPQYGEEGVLLLFGGKNPMDRGVASLEMLQTLAPFRIMIFIRIPFIPKRLRMRLRDDTHSVL